jgi:L-cysteine:1D-myo-inositol 2-amino-2-deoxy-alpha-D-glucopyranoside ligase
MRLHDTRTGGPRSMAFGRTVRLYVCGITPYDSAHLGHAAVYSAFDVLVRALERRGHVVRYVRNITDVDDDILRKAREVEMDYLDLAAKEVAAFSAALDRLGLRPPDVEPRATQAIPAIVVAIRGLLDNGAAYALPDGRVYFDTAAAGSRFGALSHLDRAEMLRQFAEKGGDPDAAGKRDPLDFLLWQPSAADEPAWDAPWGAGRPGWHIECSAMAGEELGAVVDVHGGGSDLVFPHHEAEVLQAESLTGQGPFARAWLHVGMVGLDGVKMSKSLGNLVFVADLMDRREPGAVRRLLLSHHYRDTWSYDEAAMDAAAEGYERWRDAARASGARRPDLEDAFEAALDDDLDTPTAVALMDEAAQAQAGGTVRELAARVGVHV